MHMTGSDDPAHPGVVVHRRSRTLLHPLAVPRFDFVPLLVAKSVRSRLRDHEETIELP